MAELKTVDLMLYVSEQWRSVDLDQDTAFSFNLQASDITDPTVTKIPYSSQISLPQTKTNDDIFSLIGEYGSSILNINPILRTDFVLYVNGSVFQKGYMQVESIDRIARNYKIRLYGGLGDFFYTLSDRKIKDLEFGTLFNHRINSSNLQSYWNNSPQLRTYYDYASGRNITEEIFNYAMTYQGKYDNFDSGYYVNSATDNGELIWKSGLKELTAGRELTEHERSFKTDVQIYGEYRSYMQKPMVRMKPMVNKIIELMSREENGGWETYLDPTFFNQYNPYWQNLWMVCPNYEITNDQVGDTFTNIRDNEVWDTKESDSPTFSGTVRESTDYRTLVISDGYPFKIGSYTISSEVLFNLLTTQIDGDNDAITKYYSCTVRAAVYIDGVHAFYLNESDIVTSSLTLNNTNCAAKNVVDFKNETGQGARSNPFYIYRAPSTDRKYFRKSGIKTEDARTVYKFSISGQPYNSTTEGLKRIEIRLSLDGNTDWHASSGVRKRGLRFLMQGGEFSISSSDGSGTRSGTDITYSSIIRSEHTCFDFLMSYLKPFGFHFVKDKIRNKVSILTRNTYYGLQERRDWTRKVDYSRPHETKLAPFNYKIGVLKWRDQDTKYENDYLAKYNKEYGSLRFDTGYQFNDTEKDYFSDNIFGNGIVVTSFSNYFLGRDRTLYKDNKEILHFQDSGGDGVNTGYVLCFKDGNTTLPNNGQIMITDDNNVMLELGYSYTDIGKPSTKYPAIKRTIKSGDLNYSLNFGRPEVVYNNSEENIVSKDTEAGEETIYSRFWKQYFTDRFDQENKLLTCYVNLDLADVYEDLFNKFIFIQNVPYVLNRISAYNPLSPHTTKVELISVRSIYNYLGQNYIAGKMTLTQGGKLIYDSSDTLLSANPVVLRFDSQARTVPVNIAFDPSTLTWKVVNPSPEVTVTPESGTGSGIINIYIPENDTGTVRSYYVPIQWGNSTTILQIVQVSNWTVSASSNVGTATSNGEEDEIHVQDGSIVVFETTGEDGYSFGYWQVATDSGAEYYYTRQLTLSITSNTTATAFWYSEGDFGWENYTMDIDDEGGTLTNFLNVPNGLSYTISVEGVNVEPESGVISGDIVFVVPENEDEIDRTFTVTATFNNGAASVFTINQAAPFIPELTIEPETTEVGPNITTYQIEVTSNTEWGVVIDPIYDAYVYARPLSGTGNGTVNVTVSVNPTNSPRVGLATFETTYGKDDVSVLHTVNQRQLNGTLNVILNNVSGLDISPLNLIEGSILRGSAIVDQFTIMDIPVGITSYKFEPQEDTYSIELSEYSGTGDDGHDFIITPAQSQPVEILGGETVTITYTVNIL